MPAPRKAGKEKWDAGNDTWTDRNGAVTEGMSVKGVLLRLLGEQYGINLPGSWARGTKGKPIFALPYGIEVWEVLTAMGGMAMRPFFCHKKEIWPRTSGLPVGTPR